MKEKVYFCIDLKSFFASCECVEMKVDPFKTSLVVANSHQGNGAITLAITPYLKKIGVKSRCRLYEIPSNINYKIVDPHMELYKQYSKKVVDVYLSFIDRFDIHIYSIDECFLDVTSYLKYYKKDEIDFAKMILDKIKNETGLTATCGIGNSIFLAKVAMDIEAKNNSSNIACWKTDDIKQKLWNINNLQLVWGIGPQLQKKLNNLGIYTGSDLAKCDKETLKLRLGSTGETLWNNFNGIYFDSIKSFNEAPKEKSYSHSNYLLRDYNASEILPIILKMSDKLENRLIEDNKFFSTINCKLIYSNNIEGVSKTTKVDDTNSAKIIYNTFKNLIESQNITMPIRKIEITLTKISDKKNKQLSLFEDNSNNTLSDAVFKIKEKFGYESIIKATNIKKKDE